MLLCACVGVLESMCLNITKLSIAVRCWCAEARAAFQIYFNKTHRILSKPYYVSECVCVYVLYKKKCVIIILIFDLYLTHK